MTTMTLEELQRSAFNAFQTAAGGTVVDVIRDGKVIARLSQANLTEHIGITLFFESEFYQAASGIVEQAIAEGGPVLVSTGLRNKSILIEPVR